MKKTASQLQAEIDLNKTLDLERALSNQSYAIKLVEKIVFGMVGLILTAVCIALIALVVSRGK